MDREIDFLKMGLRAGDKVILVDDDWSVHDHDMIIVDAEPVPGSTQCVVRDGDELRTVSRGALRPV